MLAQGALCRNVKCRRAHSSFTFCIGGWAAAELPEGRGFSVVLQGGHQHPGGANALVHDYYSSVQVRVRHRLLTLQCTMPCAHMICTYCN
jgi:hypothetical protein